MLQRFSILLLLLMLLYATQLSAQHPIEVQRLAAAGEYFKALASYDKMAKRQATPEAVLAAARSAWALGLPDRAIAEFDKALQKQELDRKQQARAWLSKGIIEYQEQHYQVAILFAEKAINMLSRAGALRSKAWLLWGEGLYELASYGSAADKYSKALEEASVDEQADIHYRLGLCKIKLGQLSDARSSFEQIPLGHERTASAIRYLAQIAIETKDFTSAAFWLKRGREEYPNDFLDSWVDYALVKIAISEQDAAEVVRIQSTATQRYAPSDRWLNMLNAAVEVYRWQSTQDRSKKS